MKPKIVIVAGGLALRMKPITKEIPKCLVDINGKPLIEHQLEFFKKLGYTDIIFCVAHLSEKVKEYFKDGKDFGLNIEYIQEKEELMGTAGSVKLSKNLIDSDFIVYYGDNLTNMDLDNFVRFHKEKQGIATICMRPLPEGYKSSSVIVLDDDKKIKSFVEKPSIEEINSIKGKKNINSGIYIFKKEIFRYIPKDTKFDFMNQLFPKLIKEGFEVYGYSTEEFYVELGRVEKYERFLEENKGKKIILK